MIPRTFPSTFASNGQQQMVVHFLTSVEGLARWSDYIPVKLAQGGPENSYSGCIDVVAISELTADTQAWKEYIPVYADSSATDAWTVNSVGYIPYNYALFADAAMQLDLTNGAALDPRITFSRTTNATLTNSSGLIANAPMNLLTFSEQFDNAAWTKGNATITANSAVAPDGSTTADKLVEDANTGTHQARQILTTTAFATTFSIYVKAAERSWVALAMNDASNTLRITYFDVGTGVVGTVAPNITASISAVGNGWYRCAVTVDAAFAGSNSIRTYASTGNGVIDYTGNGTSGVYLWGAQLELSSTATTYNPTTVKNLLGFTENFDNAAWTKSNASISATKVDDIYGQPFAQKLVEDTNTGVHRVGSNAPVLAGDAPYTLSFYAKAAERTQVYGLIAATTAGSRTLVRFDLSDETVVVVSGAPTSTSIQAIGSGWYRCAITYTTAASPTGTSQFIGIWKGTEIYTGDGTSGIFIFGAQLSDSASVDPYVYQPVAAPTSTAYYGPRFDYDPVTLAPKGLLIEEQRTNLLTYSEQFDNAAWIKTNATVTANTSVAPDGTTTADKLVATAAAGAHGVASSLTITQAAVYTSSCFAKQGEYRYAAITLSTSGFAIAYFDLETGVVTSVSGSTNPTADIVAVGDGWYRISITAPAGTAGAGGIFAISTPNTLLYTGDGTSGIYIWGAQLEAGAFATSYIPTVASQVTRAADSASMIGNNFARWYTQGQGTLYGEASTFAYDVSRAMFEVGDGTLANRVTVSRSGTTTSAVGSVTTSSVSQASLSVANVFVSTLYGKVSFAYTLNDFAASGNGSAAVTDTSGTVPVVDRAQIGATTTSQIHWNGTIKRIAYFNRRLSNTELQGITS